MPLTSDERGTRRTPSPRPGAARAAGCFASAAVGGAWLLTRGPAAEAVSRRLLTALTRRERRPPFAGDRPTVRDRSAPSRGRTAARLRLRRSRVGGRHALDPRDRPGRRVGEAVHGRRDGAARAGRSALGGARTLRLDTARRRCPPRTYIARVSAQRAPASPLQTHARVVRVLGVDAAFAERSALPGAPVTLVVRTDARKLTVQMLRSGPETVPTYANNEIKGIPVGDPLDGRLAGKHANAPAPISLTIGSDWPSGIYAAQLTADDGRVGFAPIVVRPTAPQHAVAVVIPTSTWGAYNFYDADGDGWGDTWYARWKTMHVDLTRPHATRGVPYRYRSYDLAFQHWLAQTGKNVDIYADEDIEAFASSADAARRVRPDRLPRAHRVRHRGGCTTSIRGLPRPRRQPAVPLGEQLLPAGRSHGPRAHADRRVARPRPAGGEPARHPVHRKRPRPTARAVHGRRRRRRSVGVRRDRARATARRSACTASRSTRAVRSRSARRTRRCSRRSRISSGPGRSAEMTYYEHPSGAQGLQRRRARLRRPGAALAADAADPRERLAAARLARRGSRNALAALLEVLVLVVARAGGAEEDDVARPRRASPRARRRASSVPSR